MSEPRLNYPDPLYGAAMEACSAQSALNMPPDPKPAPPDSNGFLTDVDQNAAHAIRHMQSVSELIERARSELEPYLAEKRIREAIMEATEEIPALIPRRPLDDDQPDLYEESDRDWFDNNRFLILWLLERYEEAVKRARK
jgi:hypothetical protein